jgi:antitoxin MazE
MKAQLVRIGNSRGVRLPKLMIQEVGLDAEVDVQVQDGAVIIRSARRTRAGWAEAAMQLRGRGEDRLLDAPTATHFDEKEWRWK